MDDEGYAREGPRGSEAVRVVPRRGGSVVEGNNVVSCRSERMGSCCRPRFESCRRMLRRSGRGPERTEFARDDMDGGFVAAAAAGDVLVVVSWGRMGSASGGGVGGNMLRLTGGADCCLVLRGRSVLTRLEAAKEIESRGLSSFPVPPRAFFFASEPAKPVKALAVSDAATSRALPR